MPPILGNGTGLPAVIFGGACGAEGEGGTGGRDIGGADGLPLKGTGGERGAGGCSIGGADGVPLKGAVGGGVGCAALCIKSGLSMPCLKVLLSPRSLLL